MQKRQEEREMVLTGVLQYIRKSNYNKLEIKKKKLWFLPGDPELQKVPENQEGLVLGWL